MGQWLFSHPFIMPLPACTMHICVFCHCSRYLLMSLCSQISPSTRQHELHPSTFTKLLGVGQVTFWPLWYFMGWLACLLSIWIHGPNNRPIWHGYFPPGSFKKNLDSLSPVSNSRDHCLLSQTVGISCWGCIHYGKNWDLGNVTDSFKQL